MTADVIRTVHYATGGTFDERSAAFQSSTEGDELT